ncbi:SDR family NAD(P)-dependent oxidoreductase [Streptococcus salivarius]|uniref:SDR family NAD(P)-dependent oxidoreductase n=4 Tax=Streptococcus TaxID=1301 RepID=UPI0012BD08F8|nr:SDR family NAD(P)-dependent oxidoreductase [Streptococcus salivarius]MTQ92512.1 SDR family NAD(P)-dependent oxidoreductase [Streptococcus salivarius]
MKNRIRFNQVNLLENNGIYIKKSNDGKTAIIFPGHGSQYVNMLSDLRGRNKIVDETLAEAENYYKGITGDSFLEHLMTSDINTVSEIMQPAIIIANEVFFRIAIQEFKVKPHILLGHSLGEISALLASGVISFKDAIKISYSRAKSLEYLDTSSQGLMLSLKLNNNKDEVLINTYLENHNNLELAIVNSKFQKVVSGAKESILRLEKYCQKVDIVAKILPVPYPFHSKLLRPIKHQYEKVIKDIEFNLPKIPVYSTILTRLYEDRDIANLVEILGEQLITPFNFREIIEVLYNTYNVKLYLECGANQIMTNLINEILSDKEHCSINMNSKKENDIVALEKSKLRLDMIKTEVNTKKVTKVINKLTGYPIELIDKIIQSGNSIEDYGLEFALPKQMQEKIVQEFNESTGTGSTYSTFNSLILEQKSHDGEPNNDLVEVNTDTTTDEPLSKVEISKVVKSFITDKTGYPEELLEDEADLEADLGIDSVKQSEIMAKVRTEFKLSDIVDSEESVPHTISDIVTYIANGLSNATSDQSEVNTDTTTDEPLSKVEISKVVKSFITDKTGYPEELLEDEADLEADLGIDSVKQSEIMAKVRTEFKLSDIVDSEEGLPHTISDIVSYIKSNQSNTVPLLNSSIPISTDKSIVNIQPDEFYEMSRYSASTIDMAINDEASYPLENRNILLIGDSKDGELSKLMLERLSESNNKVALISPLEFDFSNSEDIKNVFQERVNQLGYVDCIINLQGLTNIVSINSDMTTEEWESTVLSLYNGLFYSSKISYEFLKNHTNSAYFGVTNIGKYFGVENNQNEVINPLGALVTGFVKALEKELRPFKTKVVDIDDSDHLTNEEISNILLREFSSIGNLIEIGIKNKTRKGIVTKTMENVAFEEKYSFSSNDVVLATGGGRGITFECAKQLALKTGAKLILTGRTDIPSMDEDYIQMTGVEFDSYKSRFMIQQKKLNPKYSALDILLKYEKLRNSRILAKNIESLKNLNINFEYIKCDFASEKDVIRLKKYLNENNIQISGIINGAGLPSFGKVNAKNENAALNVVKVKANATFLLYKYFIQYGLVKFIIHMGSISGRFGMDGQVDYSAAADFLVKMSDNINSLSQTKSVVIGWPAWDEVGMATNDDVQKVQKYERGLSYISVSEGTQRFLEEIFLYKGTNEVLLFHNLGTKNMPLGQLDYTNDIVGFSEVISKDGRVCNREEYPMIDSVKYIDENKIIAKRKLSIDYDEHLKEHIVKGTSVLAGVYHVEAAAELADLYLNNFGMKEYKVAEISEFEFEKFIKVYEDREVELTLTGEILLKSDNQLVMKVTLSSDFVNSKGVVLQKNIIHSSGIIEMNNLLTTESVERYRDMLGKYNSIQIKKHLNMDKYYLKGADNIFFGPNFRNISNVRVDNSKKISIGDINVTDESKVFNFINNIDSKINPILIDNVGRLMLLNEFYQNGNTVVPTFISKTISLESFNIGEKVKAYVEKVAENGDEVIYDAFVFNESKLLLIIEQMHLTKVGQTSDYEIEI